jgi:hypothetical protein
VHACCSSTQVWTVTRVAGSILDQIVQMIESPMTREEPLTTPTCSPALLASSVDMVYSYILSQRVEIYAESASTSVCTSYEIRAKLCH